ncbi:hypothetical protein MiSe_42000 [Microseira wollei NIES-4236]|uniref:Transposase n=1 Tax=Microseira wollei NIES-4236 TaxID=2530354 RepID=A0AAV3XFF6_9CYAN|nr:hypothetical protein MiSe_42000 [Microseira wollei NIES-4236]
MWYMEGVWKPEAKAMTRHLEEDLRSRSFQEALNGMRGKLVKWSCQLTENPQDNGLAMCIYDARIVVRMIIYEETIKALRKDPSCL